MGNESPSDSDYQAASGQVSYRKSQKARERRKQEEMAMLAQEEETGKSLFARSNSGSIIRSSSGRGVTNRAGRQAQEDYRAAYSGRESRNMDEEFPMDSGGDDQPIQMSEKSKIEPKKTVKGPSAAARRLLSQGQTGQKTRQFY